MFVFQELVMVDTSYNSLIQALKTDDKSFFKNFGLFDQNWIKKSFLRIMREENIELVVRFANYGWHFFVSLYQSDAEFKNAWNSYAQKNPQFVEDLIDARKSWSEYPEFIAQVFTSLYAGLQELDDYGASLIYKLVPEKARTNEDDFKNSLKKGSSDPDPLLALVGLSGKVVNGISGLIEETFKPENVWLEAKKDPKIRDQEEVMKLLGLDITSIGSWLEYCNAREKAKNSCDPVDIEMAAIKNHIAWTDLIFAIALLPVSKIAGGIGRQFLRRYGAELVEARIFSSGLVRELEKKVSFKEALNTVEKNIKNAELIVTKDMLPDWMRGPAIQLYHELPLEEVPEKLYRIAMMDRQMRTLIVGCARGLNAEKALVERVSMTLDDVKTFLDMNPEIRSNRANSIINSVNKSAEYREKYAILKQFFVEETQTSDFWKLVKNLEKEGAYYSPRAGVLQYGTMGKEAIGPKIHIMLPSLTEKEHFEFAERLFKRLITLKEEIGDGMAFKFMKGPSGSYRMSEQQFGKDFTLYFSDYDSFLRAKDRIYQIFNDEFGKFGRTFEEVLKNAKNQAIDAPQSPLDWIYYNMGKEVPLRSEFPWITMSIRSHSGGYMRISKENAEKVGLHHYLNMSPAEQELYQSGLRDGFYYISDDYLRYSWNKDFNLKMVYAYQRGYLESVK